MDKLCPLFKFLYLGSRLIKRCSLVILMLINASLFAQMPNRLLINFKNPIESLEIVTDANKRALGLSNAAISFQNSQENKSHIFYAHLKPQPNGACFAGFKVNQTFNLRHLAYLTLTLENLSKQASHYQFVLTTTESQLKNYDYQQRFTLEKLSHKKITFPLNGFEATRRGEPYEPASDIDLSKIIAIGIRIIGRAESKSYQSGLYALRLLTLEAGENS